MGNKSSAKSGPLYITDRWPAVEPSLSTTKQWSQPSIFTAIDRKDPQRVRQLIQSGHNVNKRDGNGLTALHLAAINGDEECVRVLLSSGALIQLCPLKQTALHFAAQNGTQTMVDVLLDFGCVLNSKDSMGSTPLASAVEMNNTDTAVALLRRGATLEPIVCVAALQYGFVDLFRCLLNFRPAIVDAIDLNAEFRFTRVTAIGLKILYFAGFAIDGTLVSRIKPLDWSDFCLTGRIRLPPHHYSRDKDFEAYDRFVDWMDARDQVMSLKCMSRIAFRRACSETSVVWSLTGAEALPPDGYLFNLLVVFTLSVIFGQIISMAGLPALLGMLIIGFLLGNTLDLNLNKKLSSVLRSLALVIILLRAGLQLDPKAIIKLSAVCFRLSFMPCLVEAFTVAVVSHFLLDFPFVWGVMLGFVLAAVSPAVVVPGLISLQEKGYGVDKGVPTLVIAAASVDDVLAITGFGLCLGLVFDTKSMLLWSVLKGPAEAFAGIVYGIVMGLILWYFPHKQESQSQRISILLLSAIFALFGSIGANMGGAGPLACLVVSFVAALKWRQNQSMNEEIQSVLKTFWLIFQPFLFALIGTEVKLSDMRADAIGLALITLAIGLTFRTITAMSVVFGAKFTLKEKVFIGFSWLPKATVQAAIGPIALDMARDRADPKHIQMATLVLTIAVLSIVMTAPIGAIAIALMGPKCLNKSNAKNEIVLADNEPQSDVLLNQPLTELTVS
ncbi:unnamed protein product [Medioppia subpectinata]|uniref:Cation/H+ exchanger transmembrane domain-containing protein n=1 Tax=Medioppia subpectinata TaxID=1979941 RepID=A0A7R9PVV6_9ACAR|nr:unnamed protein product [Medioppia subpectinata]CAG2103254.1 unnamed protein product [Medioppia subpectinata]